MPNEDADRSEAERLVRVETHVKEARETLERLRDEIGDAPEDGDLRDVIEKQEQIEQRQDELWFWYRVLRYLSAGFGILVGSGIFIILLEETGVI